MLEEQPLDLSVRVVTTTDFAAEDSSTEENNIINQDSCSEDSDDSCSVHRRKPGTKPYKKNLIKRYREFLCSFKK